MTRINQQSRKPMFGAASLTIIIVAQLCSQVSGYQGLSSTRRNTLSRSKPPLILKDSFYEDNSFVVRIRTSYNSTSSITCNAVVMENQLVLSDVTCIKYSGIANIDARFVQVIAGEYNSETVYDVEQIYINKADPKDPGTELALLKLARPISVDSPCRSLLKPEINYTIELDVPVKVVGFTKDAELKENRTRVVARKSQQSSKYICTTPADEKETPGSQILKGAPLMRMVDCRQSQLLGILTKTETITESLPPVKRHQDCYVMVSSVIKWYDQVRSLATLAAKNDGSSTQLSVVVVTVPEDCPSK